MVSNILDEEMHVTQDGKTPLASDKIGSKVTQKKARMFNYDYGVGPVLAGLFKR